MEVCVVTTAFPRWFGDGEGAFVWESVRSIARRGVQVHVVAMHTPRAHPLEYWGRIQVIRPRYWLPERWEMLRKEGGGLPITWQKYPLARVQILPFFFVHTLATARWAQHCDLIHAHWSLSAAAAYLGRWKHHRPILGTVQGSDIFQVPRHPVGAWLTKKALFHCDKITALSRALREKTIGLGISPDKIHIVPNGVDTTRFVPPKDKDRENIILFVGSLIERKGVKYLLEAMPALFRALPRYHLVIVGEGPQRTLLRQLAADLGIADRVAFVGQQPQEKVCAWMQQARLLVLPSLEEGMGVAIVEALACGTPVVASRVDGIQDVVTPDVGKLTSPADSTALLEAITSILSNPSRWAEMSRNARERAVSNYDWNHIAAQFISLYQSLT